MQKNIDTHFIGCICFRFLLIFTLFENIVTLLSFTLFTKNCSFYYFPLWYSSSSFLLFLVCDFTEFFSLRWKAPLFLYQYHIIACNGIHKFQIRLNSKKKHFELWFEYNGISSLPNDCIYTTFSFREIFWLNYSC